MSLTQVLIAFAIQPLLVDGRPQAGDKTYELALRVKGMWRGYRGSQHPRPDYRQHADGFWYPERAFHLLGGQKRDSTIAHDHISWCRAKYWSYRESDDTFQPFEGERRKCTSPFQRKDPELR